MKFTQFIKMALNMTIQYYNIYVNKCDKCIKKEDICKEYTMNNREVLVCILYVKNNPDQKYVISYDKKNKIINSYLATNISDLINNGREEVHA